MKNKYLSNSELSTVTVDASILIAPPSLCAQFSRNVEFVILIFCEIAKEILDSPNLKIDYNDFFSRRIGGKSEDILLNALKAYASPLKYQKKDGGQFLYVEEQNATYLRERVSFIEKEFCIPENNSREEFFERYTYTQFCKFHGIVNQITDGGMSSVSDELGRASKQLCKIADYDDKLQNM